jgi:pimeloyl-ACP methyl ester carboxylesterase
MSGQVEPRTWRMTVNGIGTPVREVGPADDREAVVFVHGNPGSGADWLSLVDRVGGFTRAVAWDAPGFGRADKPSDFPQDIDNHATFIAGALERLGIDRAHLVLHDFGGLWGLAWAASAPERFASVVLVDTGLLVRYRWHRLARIWQARGLGELFMAIATRPAFRALLREGNPRRLPRDFADRMYDDFDRDTRRAVLRLYRSAVDIATPSRRLAAALRPLNRPALVLWGAHDPYLPKALARQQQETFPNAEVVILDDSGHWPFVDAPDRCGDLVADFLQRVRTAGPTNH